MKQGGRKLRLPCFFRRTLNNYLHISQKSCTFAAQKDTDHEFTDRNIFF